MTSGPEPERATQPPSVQRELLAILVLYAAIAVLPVLLGLIAG